MKNNLVTEENTEENTEEYRNSIKESVKNGSFFDDALDWYVFRYVSPLCDRTWLFFTTIAGVVLTYTIVILVSNLLPIVQSTPVVIKAKDTSLYRPVISKLRDSSDLRTIEEALVKRLLINYLKEREEYDFTTMTIADLNKKINIIKNNSTLDEHKRFISFIGSGNPDSPIGSFGKNVIKKVVVRYFTFQREVNEDFINKAKNFVYQPLPMQVDIGYQLTTTEDGKERVNNYVARIDFKFSKIDTKNLKKNITFEVSDYKLFIDNK